MSRRPAVHVVAALLAIVLGVAGCALTPVWQGATPPTTPSSTSTAHRPHVTLVYLRDASLSDPKQYPRQVDDYVADSLDAAVTLDQDGVTAYVNLITANSYRPESTALTITTPALPASPQPPEPQATSTPGSDPFHDAQQRAHVEAANAQAQSSYQQARDRLNTQLAAVQRAVHQQTEQLRALQSPGATHTDIWGALARASERFANQSGLKVLVVTSDMINTTAINRVAAPPLPGVSVYILDYYCVRVAECAARTEAWTQVFKRGGASEVFWYDPAETQTLPPLLSLQAQRMST